MTQEHARIIHNLKSKHLGCKSIHSGEVMSLINILTEVFPKWQDVARSEISRAIFQSLSDEFPGDELEFVHNDEIWFEGSGVSICRGTGDLIFTFDEQDSGYIRRFMTAAYQGLDNAKRVEIK